MDSGDPVDSKVLAGRRACGDNRPGDRLCQEQSGTWGGNCPRNNSAPNKNIGFSRGSHQHFENRHAEIADHSRHMRLETTGTEDAPAVVRVAVWPFRPERV